MVQSITGLSAETFVVSSFPVGEAETARTIMGQVYRSLGKTVSFREYPARRAIELANSGVTDAELIRIHNIPDNFTNLLRVPTPVMSTETVVLVQKDSSLAPSQWEDLQGIQIGIVNGVQLLETRTKGMDRTFVNAPQSLMKMVLKGRIEAAVLPATMLHTAPEVAKALKQVSPSIEVAELYHYVHKRHEALVPQLDQAIKDYQREPKSASATGLSDDSDKSKDTQ